MFTSAGADLEFADDLLICCAFKNICHLKPLSHLFCTYRMFARFPAKLGRLRAVFKGVQMESSPVEGGTDVIESR